MDFKMYHNKLLRGGAGVIQEKMVFEFVTIRVNSWIVPGGQTTIHEITRNNTKEHSVDVS
jgi:hypothetical protein